MCIFPFRGFSILLLLRMVNVYNLRSFSAAIEHVKLFKRMTRFFTGSFLLYRQYREVYFILFL